MGISRLRAVIPILIFCIFISSKFGWASSQEILQGLDGSSNQDIKAIVSTEDGNFGEVSVAHLSSSGKLIESASTKNSGSGAETQMQKADLNNTLEGDVTSESSENKLDSSNYSLYLAILSAIIGAIITLGATHLNNKFRVYELEYNYRKKMERNYLSNAQKHSIDVYIPIYKGLTDFQKYYMNSKDSKEILNKINLLKEIKDNLEEKGLTVFLTPSIESKFDRLIKFLYNSLKAKEDNYGVVIRYNILGEEISNYRKLSKQEYSRTKSTVQIIPLYLKLLRQFRLGLPFFPFSGLLNWKFELVLDSAPLNTKEFEDWLMKSIDELKNEIKDITLGIK